MDRETSINVAEKNRLRESIQHEVQRFLERGGRITVVETATGSPAKAAHGSAWDSDTDLSAGLD
jgi:hypothetical protein